MDAGCIDNKIPLCVIQDIVFLVRPPKRSTDKKRLKDMEKRKKGKEVERKSGKENIRRKQRLVKRKEREKKEDEKEKKKPEKGGRIEFQVDND